MDFRVIQQRKKIGRNVSILHRKAKKLLKTVGKEGIDVNISQLPVLSFLLDTDDTKVVSQELIGKELGADKASIARHVKELCDLGYIKRIRDRRDKRAYQLSLTPAGKELRLKIMLTMKAWTDIVYKDVTKEEMDVLERVSDKIVENIKRYEEEYRYENA